jgi:hypothetical protein
MKILGEMLGSIFSFEPKTWFEMVLWIFLIMFAVPAILAGLIILGTFYILFWVVNIIINGINYINGRRDSHRRSKTFLIFQKDSDGAIIATVYHKGIQAESKYKYQWEFSQYVDDKVLELLPSQSINTSKPTLVLSDYHSFNADNRQRKHYNVTVFITKEDSSENHFAIKSFSFNENNEILPLA